MSQQTPVTEAEGSDLATFDLEEWNAFKTTHNKQYESEEEEKKRIKIFLETKAKIAKHNANHAKGLVSFTMGINQFSDMKNTIGCPNLSLITIANYSASIVVNDKFGQPIVIFYKGVPAANLFKKSSSFS